MMTLFYNTKKELKENVGQYLKYAETSFFGEEFKADGDNTGTNLKRSWFATVTCKEGKIIKVA